MDLEGSRSDLIAGISVAGLGLYVIVASSRLAYISEYGPGPGFLPLWLGIGLLGLSLYLIASNLVRRSPTTAGKLESSMSSARALSGWAALMCAIFLLSWTGFALTFAVLAGFFIVALERRSAWIAVSVGLGLAIGFQLVFVYGLRVRLPAGPWGF
jgi:putative tricarboxylic transport membrane protein